MAKGEGRRALNNAPRSSPLALSRLDSAPMRTLPLLLLLAAPLAAQAPTVTIPRVDTTVTIDGVLDEPVWLQATRLDGFRQYQPVDGRPAEDSTVVLVWYAPGAIHVGIRAYDRQPGSVRATLADRDNIGSDDKVTVFLDTFNDRRRAYFFGVNPLGVQDDGTRSEGGFSTSGGGFGLGNTDRNPDFLWDSKGRRTPWGWEAEVRIPFKSLRWGGGEVQTWGFNVERVTQRTGYTDTWTDVRRGNASFLAQAGSITGIRDISRGVVVELQPTFVADAPGIRTPSGFERDGFNGEVGANARLGFTRLTIDGTYNPDFSQVESDVGLVTINERFALFFPERRPFFLEGVDLFSSPNNLVYTRTVANPLAGAKVTGKFGSWSLAHLTAIDEFSQSRTLPPGDDALANITRVRRDIGDNSVAGVTLTNRDEGDVHNRVLAADTRLVFGTVYYFAAQAGLSTTRVVEGDVSFDRSDPIWELEVDRTGRAFGFNYKVTAIGDDFETWSGFVNRTGIATGRFNNRYRYYGARGALLEEFTVFGGLNRIWEYGSLLGSEALEGGNEINLSANLRGGWRARTSSGLGFVRFHPEDYAGYGVQRSPTGPVEQFVPQPGVFDAANVTLSVNTPTWRAWDASLQVNASETAIFPEAAEGRSFRVSGGVNFRFSDATRLTGSLTYQRLTRERDGSEFARTILPRIRLEYQPSRALFFRAVAEYRSERRAALVDSRDGSPIVINGTPSAPQRTDRLRLDLLGSFEPSPGTVAYLGYGSTLRGDRPLTFRDLERSDDAFFLKLAYLMRW